jgi:hypothetical protein
MKTEPKMKRCPRCGDLPATPEFFGRNAARSDGLAAYCRACRREKKTSADLAELSPREQFTADEYQQNLEALLDRFAVGADDYLRHRRFETDDLAGVAGLRD